MWPSEVPSDFDVDEASREALEARWGLLLDLHNDFQGSAFAYAIFAVLLPGLGFASIYFEWSGGVDDPAIQLLISVALFVSLGSISLYSLVWYFWEKKRLKRVEKLMGMNDD
jgi:hypothetical protein